MSFFNFSQNIQKSLYKLPKTQKYQFKICKVYIHCLQEFLPKQTSLCTGRLIKILSEYESGLGKDDLLQLFYEDYTNASDLRQESLKKALEKTIQRSRKAFAQFNLAIRFEKKTRKYKVELISANKRAKSLL